MAAKKGSSTSKVSSKMAASNGQHDLFHFYQKQTKIRVVEQTAHSGPLDMSVNDKHGTEKDPIGSTDDEISLSVSSRGQSNNVETTADGMVSADRSQNEPSLSSSRLPPSGKAPPLMRDVFEPSGIIDRPAKGIKSEINPPNVKLQASEDCKAESSMNPRKAKKLFSIFEKSGATSDLSRSASRDVTTGPQEVHSKLSLPKKSRIGNQIDIIDLTDSPTRNVENIPPGLSQGHDPIIIVDDNDLLTRLSCGSQETPIELSSSPPADVPPANIEHPFFARNAAKNTKKNLLASSLNSSLSNQMDVPWPNAENQHTTGPQGSFWTSDSSIFGKSRKSSPPVWFETLSNLRFLEKAGIAQHPDPDAFVAGMDIHAPTRPRHETVLSSLPSTHRDHPGITRLLIQGQPLHKIAKDEIWSQKWRPRQAAEVLGNEDHASYIKTWLQALAIHADVKSGMVQRDKSGTLGGTHGIKRPTVIRAVNKKQRRKRRKLDSEDGSSFEDWIVDQEAEAEENEVDLEHDHPLHWSPTHTAGPGVSPLISVGPSDVSLSYFRDEIHPPEFSTLTNTILLAGPPGSGKTSTIYACAEELGWEVFEVYPGIGKRSGSSISSLIGEVGKNHLVGRRGVYSESSNKRSGLGYLLSESEKTEATHADNGQNDIRQSIILLDEVDILFKDDANFWPTVVNIIKTSHRPVFITCNDVSLVPQDDLPLQKCLHFQPCPEPLAVSFLHYVCLAEGYFVPRKQLEMMYSTTFMLISCDEPDQPPVPFPSQSSPAPDLRRTLNQLQLCCPRDQSAIEDPVVKDCDVLSAAPGIMSGMWAEMIADWSQPLDAITGSSPVGNVLQDQDIYRLGIHADCMSYIDAYLERRLSDTLEASGIDRYGPSGDDEIGYTNLDKPRTSEGSKGLAFFSRDTDIARETLVLSRHVFEISSAGARVRGNLRGERGSTRLLDAQSQLRARVANQTQAVSFLDAVISLPGPLLPRAPAVLEYMPYVRHMILIDDALEGEEPSERSRLRRGRGWRMGEYVRYLPVSEEGRKGARDTMFH